MPAAARSVIFHKRVSHASLALANRSSELQHHLERVLCRISVILLAPARRPKAHVRVERLRRGIRSPDFEHAEGRSAKHALRDRRLEQRSTDSDSPVVGVRRNIIDVQFVVEQSGGDETKHLAVARRERLGDEHDGLRIRQQLTAVGVEAPPVESGLVLDLDDLAQIALARGNDLEAHRRPSSPPPASGVQPSG